MASRARGPTENAFLNLLRSPSSRVLYDYEEAIRETSSMGRVLVPILL
jgi:hypothetical protein